MPVDPNGGNEFPVDPNCDGNNNYRVLLSKGAVGQGSYSIVLEEDGSFQAVICLEVLEHVRDPFRAAAELRRVLAPGGTLLLTTPFLLQYHGKGGSSHSHGSYPDFWRFTYQGLQRLFEDFEAVELAALDGPIEFRLKQFYLRRLLGMGPVRRLVDAVDRPRVGKATTRHLLFARRPG